MGFLPPCTSGSARNVDLTAPPDKDQRKFVGDQVPEKLFGSVKAVVHFLKLLK